MFFNGLYCITNSQLSHSHNTLYDIEEMCRGGCKIVQLREKTLSIREVLALAREVRDISCRYGTKLIINDSIEIAVQSQADGVHLGHEYSRVAQARAILGLEAIIGVSVSSLGEFRDVINLLHSCDSRATYIGAGSVFPTLTKPHARILGLEVLRYICQLSPIPVVAIGGINALNFDQVLATGVSGIAMIQAIVTQPHIRETVASFINRLQSSCPLSSLRKHGFPSSHEIPHQVREGSPSSRMGDPASPKAGGMTRKRRAG